MFLLFQKSFNFLGVKGVEVPSREGCPLTQTFYTKKIDIYMNLWLQELGSYPRDWGNLRLWRVTLRNPSSTRGITERFRSMEPPLWVKGDRGRSEKQEILTVRCGCPVRDGGVVHRAS